MCVGRERLSNEYVSYIPLGRFLRSTRPAVSYVTLDVSPQGLVDALLYELAVFTKELFVVNDVGLVLF